MDCCWTGTRQKRDLTFPSRRGPTVPEARLGRANVPHAVDHAREVIGDVHGAIGSNGQPDRPAPGICAADGCIPVRVTGAVVALGLRWEEPCNEILHLAGSS